MFPRENDVRNSKSHVAAAPAPPYILIVKRTDGGPGAAATTRTISMCSRQQPFLFPVDCSLFPLHYTLRFHQHPDKSEFENLGLECVSKSINLEKERGNMQLVRQNQKDFGEVTSNISDEVSDMKRIIRRYELTDAEWERLKPYFPERQLGDKGRPRREPREILNGIFWIARSGAAWRDLPERYGPYSTVYKRFREWSESGLIEKIFHELGEDADLQDISIDSTYIKAHKASAGAERGGSQNPLKP